MAEQVTVRGVIPHLRLADRLLIARRFAGVDQRELAAMIGVSARTVGAAENGQSRPRRPVLLAWAMATGVSLEWIIEGDLIPDASGQASEEVIFPGSTGAPFHGSSLALGGMTGRPPVRGATGRPPGRPRPRLRPGPRGGGANLYQAYTGT